MKAAAVRFPATDRFPATATLPLTLRLPPMLTLPVPDMRIRSVPAPPLPPSPRFDGYRLSVKTSPPPTGCRIPNALTPAWLNVRPTFPAPPR